MNNIENFYQKFFNFSKSSHIAQSIKNVKKKIISCDGKKGIFDLNDRSKKYIQTSVEISREISSNYNTLVVCGMGGSSLGAKAICGYKFLDLGYSDLDNGKKIHFLDNIHHQNLYSFLKKVIFSDTAFLFISKSGNTIESMCQTLLITEYYKKELLLNKAKNLYFITSNDIDKNPLAKIANNYRRPIINCDKDIEGRYSCFTTVALIPAAFYNTDINQYINGAITILNDFINCKTNLVEEGVEFLCKSREQNLDIQVSMPYLSRLYHFNYWYSQLLAESIGKNCQGITPLKALGSVDQHSVLQLFLDGPRNKFFTFLTSDTRNMGNSIKLPNYLSSDLDYLQNNKLGDVMYANQEATIKVIKDKNYLLRRFNIGELNEYTLGQIMMYFMLETVLYAKYINVNPFDQPAVEEGKSYTKKLLKNNLFL